jgi:hypothetical protein
MGRRNSTQPPVISVIGTSSASRVLVSTLANYQFLDQCISMDATKIIDEIKLLPADEKVKVIEYIRTIPNEETVQAIDEPSDTLQRFNSVDALFSELES